MVSRKPVDVHDCYHYAKQQNRALVKYVISRLKDYKLTKELIFSPGDAFSVSYHCHNSITWSSRKMKKVELKI